MVNKTNLKKRILEALKESGFKINPHLRPPSNNKNTLRRIQQTAKNEQISLHSKFLQENFDIALSHCRNGQDIIPNEIDLELREVKSESFEETVFRWWNFIWWSIPYQHPYGRQMRFLLWDRTHDSPFGLISLQSPVLKMSVRDNALGIHGEKLHTWVNRSLHAQRVGALPPYNGIIGGKMVALALTANEIRNAYKKKYANYISIIKKDTLKPDLLFITTTSAFGKSSIYNRLKYNGDLVAKCLGYTQGTGSFHIPTDLYEELVEFLAQKDYNVDRGFGHGPSRKLRLISVALRELGLADFECHGIKREFYLFPLVKNLKNVIHRGKRPLRFNRPFDDLVSYWKERWALPRADRKPEWKYFTTGSYFKKVRRMLNQVQA